MTTQTTPPNKALNIALWIVQILLAAAFFMAGAMKLGSPISELVANGMAFADRVPEALVRFIGAAEVLGAIGLIVPAATRILPKLTPTAGAALALVMVLAAGHHLLNAEYNLVPNLVLGGLSGFIAWGRFSKVPIQPR